MAGPAANRALAQPLVLQAVARKMEVVDLDVVPGRIEGSVLKRTGQADGKHQLGVAGQEGLAPFDDVRLWRLLIRAVEPDVTRGHAGSRIGATQSQADSAAVDLHPGRSGGPQAPQGDISPTDVCEPLGAVDL